MRLVNSSSLPKARNDFLECKLVARARMGAEHLPHSGVTDERKRSEKENGSIVAKIARRI